jgi:serpin B
VLNTVYCKNMGIKSSQKNDTDDDKFMTASGDIADVKMMHQQQKLLYLKGETFRAVAVPYAGNRQTFFIFLPYKKTSSASFQTEFTIDNWRNWLDKFRMTDVKLVLPKFLFSLEQDLSAGLKSIGMSGSFNLESADFSKLVCFGYKTSISRVLQSVYFEIDESAIEDTASSVAMGVREAESIVKPIPVEFRVDHPFVLALVDNDSKEILFLGSIVKP